MAQMSSWRDWSYSEEHHTRERYKESSYMSWGGRQEMVQVVVCLLHPREQGSVQRLSLSASVGILTVAMASL